MNRQTQQLVYALLVLGLAGSPLAQAKTEYDVAFVPLNSSGVNAEAEVELHGKTLKVFIEASGLEIGKPHPQHIHGHSDSSINSSCPDSSADQNADGLVSVGEGLPSYGPIILPLNPFNLVDHNGNLSYELEVSIKPADLRPLHKRTIVLHGMSINGEYIASLPVACGEIRLDD